MGLTNCARLYKMASLGCLAWMSTGWDETMATNQEAQRRFPQPVMSTLLRQFSKNSRRYKTISQWAVGLALVLIAISTAASAFHVQSPHFTLFDHSLNAVTTGAVVCFLAASFIRLYRIARGPERIWFSSRELAERTRSLIWQYAVAGGPFPRPVNGPDNADTHYQHLLDKIAVEARDSGVRYRTPHATTGIHVITDWMRETRAKNLMDRRAIYATQRIEDQEGFYITREHEKSRAATISQVLLYVIEIVGAVVAALNAIGYIQLDFVGVAGTVAAGVAAWVQFNQFTELAGTYSAMAYRMAGYRERCLRETTPWTEEDWAKFVSEVEDTLSEEHGAWRHIVQQGVNEVV